MSEYFATTIWQRNGVPFVDNLFSREHRWLFDGGIEVPASASPHIVATPMAVHNAVDPEEAFVAALSSCHMLCFLSLAAKRGHVVDSYRDEASGLLAKNSAGRLAMSQVTLRPRIEFDNPSVVTSEVLSELHHAAHESCFIANSVQTEIVIEHQLNLTRSTL